MDSLPVALTVQQNKGKLPTNIEEQVLVKFNKFRRESLFGCENDVQEVSGLDGILRKPVKHLKMEEVREKAKTLVTVVRTTYLLWLRRSDANKVNQYSDDFNGIEKSLLQLTLIREFLLVKLDGNHYFNLSRKAQLAEWMPVFLVIGAVIYNIFQSYMLKQYDAGSTAGQSATYISAGVLAIAKFLQNTVILSSPEKVKDNKMICDKIDDLFEFMSPFLKRQFVKGQLIKSYHLETQQELQPHVVVEQLDDVSGSEALEIQNNEPGGGFMNMFRGFPWIGRGKANAAVGVTDL